MSRTIEGIVALGTAAVIATSSIGCAANNPPATNPQQKTSVLELSEMPPSVFAKHRELEELYGGARGAWIHQCVKGREKIFEVSGSGGFTGEYHYYTEEGRYIGEAGWSDALPFYNQPKPPVNIKEYNCS